jgi:hypothetical protein
MHGRPALFAKIFVASTACWLIAGCHQPRIKSYESTEAATLTNPPRDFKAEPLDPYSWGGIAMATGGRDSRTTYGAMAPGEEGVDEVYLPIGAKLNTPNPADETNRIYKIPDPRFENKVAQFTGSSYLDNDGHEILMGDQLKPNQKNPRMITQYPPRAGLVKAASMSGD